MGLTFLSALGRLLWPFGGAWAAWAGPKTVAALGGALLALVLIGGPAGLIWVNGRHKVKIAVASERQQCELARVAANNRALEVLFEIGREADADLAEAESAAAICERSGRLCRKGKP